MRKVECPIWQGLLWLPRNVGGVCGNTNLDEAIRLIRAGRKSWARDRY
jgi:hypothetical protein